VPPLTTVHGSKTKCLRYTRTFGCQTAQMGGRKKTLSTNVLFALRTLYVSFPHHNQHYRVLRGTFLLERRRLPSRLNRRARTFSAAKRQTQDFRRR